MYAMRNLIAHDYLGINERRVWRTATEELAGLARGCREELAGR